MSGTVCVPRYSAVVARLPGGMGRPDAARSSVSTTVSVRSSARGRPLFATAVMTDAVTVSAPAPSAHSPARWALRDSQPRTSSRAGPSGGVLCEPADTRDQRARIAGRVRGSGATAANLTVRVRGAMEIREVMTESVVTTASDAPVRRVAEIMRERNVGSVVLVDAGGGAVGFITDRDLAVSVLADGHGGDATAADHASSPVVTGSPHMDVTEATDLMVRHGIRRLPIVEDGRLTGIVTLDDLAARIGDVDMAASITAQVTRAALPDFYFHDRGG
jgi:CBS domain-containing protein